MRRRDFIAGVAGVVASPLVVRAQAERTRLVGVLNTGEDDPEMTQRFAVVRQALGKAGWVEGRNIWFEFRSASADLQRARAYAEELVRLPADVIVTTSNIATVTVARQTKTIPIIFASAGDPLGTGIVKTWRGRAVT